MNLLDHFAVIADGGKTLIESFSELIRFEVESFFNFLALECLLLKQTLILQTKI